ncbi:DUF6479 family protein [Streptomyces sp. NPDC089919]|uniref:DUF6479 family protein n=1 Tax=Streptomyces sp. NPDC089919 TaxID=3155188 RepID=UPI003420742F
MDTFAEILPFLMVGVAVSGFLLFSFWGGMRVRDREPAPPTPESQPHLPEGGAVLEVREEREHVEFPKGGLQPHEMMGYGNFGSRSAEHPDAAHQQWTEQRHEERGERPKTRTKHWGRHQTV